MKHIVLILTFTFFVIENSNSQIIDYRDKNGNTGFELNKSVTIPYNKDKIAIFIFEKRSSSYDPGNISLSEQLSMCNIDFDKFIIYRFNLVSGMCNKFDSVKYILNGSNWLNKPKSMDIKKHYVCISTPDTTTYNLIRKKFGEEIFNSKFLNKFQKKINYPNPIAFVSFDDANQISLETELFDLISKNDVDLTNKKIQDLRDSLNLIKLQLLAEKPKYNLSLFGEVTEISNPSIFSSKYFNNSIGLTLSKSEKIGNHKIQSSIQIKSSELNLNLINSEQTISTGVKTDLFNDAYYGYYQIPKFTEQIRITYQSIGLGVTYFLGKNRNSFIHGTMNYNFGGNHFQQFQPFTVINYGRYPSLDFDTLILSTNIISKGNLSLQESFVSGVLGMGKNFALIQDMLNLGLSVNYTTTENLLILNEARSTFSEINKNFIFNSKLNSLTNFNVRGFTFKIQLEYAF